MSFAWHEIRDHLMRSSSTFRFQQRFGLIGRDDAALVRFPDPAAVLDYLHHDSASALNKNLVLEALVRAAQADRPQSDPVLTVLLLALWPGLDAVRQRCQWQRIASVDDLPSEILARATDALRCVDLARVNWIAATVLRNIERDILRKHCREVARPWRHAETDPDSVTGASLPATSHAQLRAEVARCVGSDATLVMRVAVEGFSQAEAAAELGISHDAARKRYQRAQPLLRKQADGWM